MGFEVIPGDRGSAVVLHVPHSSRVIPAWARERILLTDEALAAELDAMTDADTDLIADAVTAAVVATGGPGPWRFVNRLSRLVVDPERFDDDSEEMNAVGMGAVYLRTSDGGLLRDEKAVGFAEHRDRLMARCFRPYAAGLQALVDELLAAHGRVLLLDLHSYPPAALPYELHAADARPEVCLGTHPLHTPARLLAAARSAFAEFEVALDQPFRGTYVPSAQYGSDRRVQSLMVELRRDVYLSAPEGAEAPGFDGIVRAVRSVIDWFG